MIALRLCWPIFALWYIWQENTSYPVSAQLADRTFELVNGGRYGSGILASRRAGSLMECAAMCLKERSCSDFNYGFSQCELLSATSSCRNIVPGLTHGYHPTGQYQTTPHESPLSLTLSRAGFLENTYKSVLT